jgi:hypothetical protein
MAVTDGQIRYNHPEEDYILEKKTYIEKKPPVTLHAG